MNSDNLKPRTRLTTFMGTPGEPPTTIVSERGRNISSTIDYDVLGKRPGRTRVQPSEPRMSGLVRPSVSVNRLGVRERTGAQACQTVEPFFEVVPSKILFWVKGILEKAELHRQELDKIGKRQAEVRKQLARRQSKKKWPLLGRKYRRGKAAGGTLQNAYGKIRKDKRPHLDALDVAEQQILDYFLTSEPRRWKVQWLSLSESQKALANELVEEKLEYEDEGLEKYEVLTNNPIGREVLRELGSDLGQFIRKGADRISGCKARYGELLVQAGLNVLQFRAGGFYDVLAAMDLGALVNLRRIEPAFFDACFGSVTLEHRFSWSQKLGEYLGVHGGLDCAKVFEGTTNRTDFACELSDENLELYLARYKLGLMSQPIDKAGIKRVCARLKTIAGRHKEIQRSLSRLESDTLSKIASSQSTYEALKKYAFFLDNLKSPAQKRLYLSAFPGAADLHCAGGTSARLQMHLDSIRASWLGNLVRQVVDEQIDYLSRKVREGNQVHVAPMTKALMRIYKPKTRFQQHPLEVNYTQRTALDVDSTALSCIGDIDAADAFKVAVSRSDRLSYALSNNVELALLDGWRDGSGVYGILEWLYPEDSRDAREKGFQQEGGDLNAAKLVVELGDSLRPFLNCTEARGPGVDVKHPLVTMSEVDAPFWEMGHTAVQCLEENLDDPMALSWFDIAHLRFAGHQQEALQSILEKMTESRNRDVSDIAMTKMLQVKEYWGYFSDYGDIGEALSRGWAPSNEQLREFVEQGYSPVEIKLEHLWNDPILIDRFLEYERSGIVMTYSSSVGIAEITRRVCERNRQGPWWRLLEGSPAVRRQIAFDMSEDIKNQEQTRKTLLQCVCERGNNEDVRRTIQLLSSLSPNSRFWLQYLDWRPSNGGSTALVYGLANRDPEIVGQLVAAGADPLLPDGYGLTILARAAGLGMTRHVEMLIEAVRKIGQTSVDETDLVEFLNVCARIPPGTSFERNALEWAIARGKTESALLLLEVHDELEGIQRVWVKYLMLAARVGDATVVEAILERVHNAGENRIEGFLGLFVNSQGCLSRSTLESYSPLHYAYAGPKAKRKEIVGLLLNAGADPDARDWRNRRPEKTKQGSIEV